MASSSEKAAKSLNILNSAIDIKGRLNEIKNKSSRPLSVDDFPKENEASNEGQLKRLDYLAKETGEEFEYLINKKSINDPFVFRGNIENYIGLTQVPTGVIGPLRVIGASAHGDFYVPLATSEGALVASYHRGAKATRLAGGVTSICFLESVQRSPAFKFNDTSELIPFLIWVLAQVDIFKMITEKTSRFAKLLDFKSNIEGNHLTITFEYYTGDASGQNMVTFCTEAICKYIIENAPVTPVYFFIEGNYSGDKKATALSFSNVRGKKITAEVVLSKDIVRNVLKTSVKGMVDYWQTSTMGIMQSGAIGAHGHYANGLTALFMATGQDVACVAEAAVGITRMEFTAEEDLYASVTLPNLIVGTVGGGTGLPTQKECLKLMGCYGEGKARKYAEICGALVLCGELSIAAALSAGHFASAHKSLGRKK